MPTKPKPKSPKRRPKPTWHIYAIECDNKSIYIGQTKDLETPLEPACYRERRRGLDEKAQASPNVSHRESQNHKRGDDQRTEVENFNRQAQVEKDDSGIE